MSLKHELQDIIAGNGSVRCGETIQAISAYLRRKKEAGSGVENGWTKVQETEALKKYISNNHL